MVGFGAARLASAHARTFESWRCSSCANAESKNLAWCCQAGSFVSGNNGEPSDGIMPARKRAVSSMVAVSAARAPGMATRNRLTARAAIVIERSMFRCGLGCGCGAGLGALVEDSVDQKTRDHDQHSR